MAIAPANPVSARTTVRRSACLVEGQFSPDGEEKRELGQDAAHEPVGLQDISPLIHKDCEEHEIKDGAHHAEQGGNKNNLLNVDTFLAW